MIASVCGAHNMSHPHGRPCFKLPNCPPLRPYFTDFRGIARTRAGHAGRLSGLPSRAIELPGMAYVLKCCLFRLRV